MNLSEQDPQLRRFFLVAVPEPCAAVSLCLIFWIAVASPGLGLIAGAGPGAGVAAFHFVTFQSVVELLG